MLCLPVLRIESEVWRCLANNCWKKVAGGKQTTQANLLKKEKTFGLSWLPAGQFPATQRVSLHRNIAVARDVKQQVAACEREKEPWAEGGAEEEKAAAAWVCGEATAEKD